MRSAPSRRNHAALPLGRLAAKMLTEWYRWLRRGVLLGASVARAIALGGGHARRASERTVCRDGFGQRQDPVNLRLKRWERHRTAAGAAEGSRHQPPFCVPAVGRATLTSGRGSSAR